MKQILLLRQIFTATILLITYCANAQWVSIPDTIFGHWLSTNNFSQCLSGSNSTGWQLDTNCIGVLNETTISCNYYNVTSFDGIEFFKSLKVFYCVGNKVASFRKLPDSIETLSCINNSINHLPKLPSSLINLYCSSNFLDSLPSLPNNLVNLVVDKNIIYRLDSLPLSLKVLRINNNKLRKLPSLPSSLEILDCDYNLIDTVPSLPENLKRLWCGSNNLTYLPSIPSSLTELNCSSNLLSSIPALPDSLTLFNCYDNPQIKCLPKLGYIENFDIYLTGITCLPNYPRGNFYGTPFIFNYPLCDPFNSKGCDNYYNVSGTVYGDNKIHNCFKDLNEPHIKNLKVLLYKKGGIEQQTILKSYGTFSFDTDLDTFEIRIDTTDLPYTVDCPSNFSLTSILTQQDSVDTDRDFGLICKTGFDLGVHSAVRDSGILFPAQKAGVHINTGDISQLFGLNCATGIGGKVVVVYSGPVSYSGVRPGALTPAVNGKTLTYTIVNFGAIDINTALGLIFLTDTFAQVGQQLCLSITVIPDVAGDINNTNNTLRICFPILNSYDPNMKEVSPVNTIAPDEDWLTYTIHFQNMGNAPAIHIYVMDTLDNNLDESSIQILGSSHRMLTEIKGNIARFNFPNINLIDSATNEPESKGWLQYKIKKNTGLALGTQIKNTASIYFDFNAPVVTNTVTNTVEEPSAVKENREQMSEIRLFPNPTNDVVYISYSANTSADVTLFNINGAACLKQQLTASNQSISLSGLPAGVYFVSVEIQGSVVRKKVVKW